MTTKRLSKHLLKGHAIGDHNGVYWLSRDARFALIHGVVYELVCMSCDAPNEGGQCPRCHRTGGRWFPCTMVTQDKESLSRRVEFPMQALAF